MRKQHLWWFIALAWCVLIFLQSHKPAIESAQESGTITLFINQLLQSMFGAGKIAISETLIRKIAHFAEYFILGFVLFKAYFNAEKLHKTFWLATITSVLYAVSDEVHQSFIPGRAMRVYDIFIDSVGIILAAFILLHRAKRHAIKGQASCE